ncbi:MAG: transposase [Pirellulaceae bacterium]|nr:transposase [Pirellulaceae bacterium]
MNTQPHRKRVKRHHNPGDFHELTFSTYRRTPLLTNDLWRIELSRCIDQANQTHQFELTAFVYMPEHLHLLVFPLTTQPDIGRYLAAIKQPLSSFVHSCLKDAKSPLPEKLTVRERPGKRCFRFWQEGPGFDRTCSPLRLFKGRSTTSIAILSNASYADEQLIIARPVLATTWLSPLSNSSQDSQKYTAFEPKYSIPMSHVSGSLCRVPLAVPLQTKCKTFRTLVFQTR